MPFTISAPTEFTGIGLHSGEQSKVSVYPSEQEGICFLTENGLFPITSVNVEEDRRLTGFRLPDGTIVRTAEHLLAAFTGLGIDSVVIRLEGEEIPILDGSPHPFAVVFSETGITQYGGNLPKKAITVPVVIDDPDRDRSIMAIPAERLPTWPWTRFFPAGRGFSGKILFLAKRASTLASSTLKASRFPSASTSVTPAHTGTK